MPKSEIVIKRQTLPSGDVVKDIDDVRRHGLKLEEAVEEITDRPSLPQIARQLDYPVNKLGSVLGEAAIAIAESVQTPVEIAAHSVLTAAAFASQDKANVLIDGREMLRRLGRRGMYQSRRG